jgi:hypothetical protein
MDDSTLAPPQSFRSRVNGGAASGRWSTDAIMTCVTGRIARPGRKRKPNGVRWRASEDRLAPDVDRSAGELPLDRVREGETTPGFRACPMRSTERLVRFLLHVSSGRVFDRLISGMAGPRRSGNDTAGVTFHPGIPVRPPASRFLLRAFQPIACVAVQIIVGRRDCAGPAATNEAFRNDELAPSVANVNLEADFGRYSEMRRRPPWFEMQTPL